MAARGISIVLRANRIPGLLKSIDARSIAAVDTAADTIRDRASQSAPRDTGSLADSIYVSNANASDYAQRAGSAHSLNSDAVIVPEVNPSLVISLGGTTANAYVSVVGVAVSHGIFNELGTRFMPPSPFMIPAVLATQDDFITEMSHVAD